MLGSLVSEGEGVDLDLYLDVWCLDGALWLGLLWLLWLRHFAWVCGRVIGVGHWVGLGLAGFRWVTWVLLWLFLLHVLGTSALEGLLLLLREGTDVAEVPPAVHSLGLVWVLLLIVIPVFLLLVLDLEH